MPKTKPLPSQPPAFAEWTIVELMGHRRLAGRVTEATIAGAGFLRIDVYAGKAKKPAATQFVAPASVYALTPTTEDICRHLGITEQPAPVSRFELPARAGDSGARDTDAPF